MIYIMISVLFLIIPAAVHIYKKKKRKNSLLKKKADIKETAKEMLSLDLGCLNFVQKYNEQNEKLEITGSINPNIAVFRIDFDISSEIIRIKAVSKNNFIKQVIFTMQKAPGNFETGDRRFDNLRLISSTGKKVRLKALMSERIRNMILSFKKDFKSITMKKGILEINTTLRKYIKNEKMLYNTVLKINNLFELLSDNSDTEVLLKNNIKNDSKSEVKLANLKEYTKYYLKGKKLPDFISNLIYEKKKNLSLEAARLMGKKGIKVLHSIILNTEKLYSKVQRKNAVKNLIEVDGKNCLKFLYEAYLLKQTPRWLGFSIIYFLSDSPGSIPVEVITKALEKGSRNEKALGLNMAVRMNAKKLLPLIHEITNDKKSDYFLRNRAANAARQIIESMENKDPGMLSVAEVVSEADGALSITDKGNLSNTEKNKSKQNDSEQ
jgi:hypothetical protein